MSPLVLSITKSTGQAITTFQLRKQMTTHNRRVCQEPSMEGNPGGIPFSRQNKTNRSPVWRAMLVVYRLVGKVRQINHHYLHPRV